MENIRTNPNGVEYKHMTTTEILTKELTNFIESLRLADYNIGATQYIATQDLILTLAAQGKLPSELTELRQFLAPILCHSPKEQEGFEIHFNQWVNKFPQTKTTSETEASLLSDVESELRIIKKGNTLWKYFNQWVKQFLQTKTTSEIETSPLSDLESELRTIKKGNTLWKWAFIAFIIVFIFSIFVYWSDIATAQSIQSVSDEIAQPVQPDEIPPANSSLWNWLLVLQIWFTLLSPLLVLLLWQLWWRYRAQLFLARRSTTAQPDIKKLFVKETDDKFFQLESLAHTAQKLRQHISVPANLLDIAATVEKTIQAGGWFTPVTGTIKTRPEYLALIDKTTFNDHQTQLINSLINKLVDDDVLVTRYYFDTVPRRCYPEQSKQAPFTLPELAQHYPNHRLLIFSDGNGFVNPITGKVINWIEQFSVWSQRVLFTLETPEQWGYREQILDGANFLILPANEEGLKGLVERINTGTWQPYPKPSDSFSKEFPEYLQERPRRWLEHHAPDASVLTELLQQVRDFLGNEGYYWFSACAIYPELRWHLTLYLGEQLKSLDEERLVKLARLPWFRYGYMPDWLRKQLIKELSLHQEHKIRTTLYNRLLETSDKPLSDSCFEIAKPQQNTLSVLAQWLLSMWAKKASKNSPLHDHVFMTFMGDKLAVKIPKILHNYVFMTFMGDKLAVKMPNFLCNLFAQSPELTEPKKLSALNPLDHLRLLWWILVMPQKLIDYREGFGEKDDKYVGKWLIITLTWLPWLMPCFALGLECLPHSNNAWLPETYLWMISVGFAGCWLLKGVGSDLNEDSALSVLIYMMIGVLIGVANGMALSVAIGVAIGVVIGLIKGVADAVALSMKISVIIITMIGVTSIVASVMASVIASVMPIGVIGGVALLVALLVEKSLETGPPSWLARLGFLLLIAAHLFLIYYCFLDG